VNYVLHPSHNGVSVLFTTGSSLAGDKLGKPLIKLRSKHLLNPLPWWRYLRRQYPQFGLGNLVCQPTDLINRPETVLFRCLVCPAFRQDDELTCPEASPVSCCLCRPLFLTRLATSILAMLISMESSRSRIRYSEVVMPHALGSNSVKDSQRCPQVKVDSRSAAWAGSIQTSVA